MLELGGEIRDALKIPDQRKVQAKHAIGSVLPQGFDGKALKVSEPMLEKRLKGGNQKRLAKTSRAGEKNFGIMAAKLEYEIGFVYIQFVLCSKRGKS